MEHLTLPGVDTGEVESESTHARRRPQVEEAFGQRIGICVWLHSKDIPARLTIRASAARIMTALLHHSLGHHCPKGLEPVQRRFGVDQ